MGAVRGSRWAVEHRWMQHETSVGAGMAQARDHVGASGDRTLPTPVNPGPPHTLTPPPHPPGAHHGLLAHHDAGQVQPTTRAGGRHGPSCWLAHVLLATAARPPCLTTRCMPLPGTRAPRSTQLPAPAFPVAACALRMHDFLLLHAYKIEPAGQCHATDAAKYVPQQASPPCPASPRPPARRSASSTCPCTAGGGWRSSPTWAPRT